MFIKVYVADVSFIQQKMEGKQQFTNSLTCKLTLLETTSSKPAKQLTSGIGSRSWSKCISGINTCSLLLMKEEMSEWYHYMIQHIFHSVYVKVRQVSHWY